MWALVESGSISKIFTRPTQLTIGDIKYPRNIFEIWSESELKSIGIYTIVIDNTNLKDSKYYINTNQSFNFASDTVTATYGTATAKSLDDVTDEDGNITRGLKYQSKENINKQAGSILSDTDWMVIRETDGGTAMPSNIKTWRASVRTKANNMCTQIDNAADVDALAALYVYTNTGTEENPVYTRPLGEFPELS